MATERPPSKFDPGQERDLFGRMARYYDTDRDDPRLNEIVSKVLNKGMDPNQWLDAKIGTRPAGEGIDAYEQGRDPRQGVSAARPPTRDTDATGPIVRDAPILSQVGAAIGTPEGRGALAKDFDRRATEMAAFPSMAVDAATLGVYRKARDAVTGAIAPEATAQMQATEQGIEQDAPLAANTARGIGYLSPTGPAAMIGRVGSALAKPLGSLLPQWLARPVVAGTTGAVAGGGTAAGEAAVEDAPLEEVVQRGLRGAAVGGAFGTAFGLGQAGIDAAAGAVNKRIDTRVRHAYTQDAPAGVRDKVVGKGGVKADRVSETIRRDEGLMSAVDGDSVAKADAIAARQSTLKGNNRELYGGVQLAPDDVIQPILAKAIELEQNPGTAALADDMIAEAEKVQRTWGRRGAVDATDVREYITTIGRSLFKNNPNADVPTAIKARQELYGDLVDTITGAVDRAKPGRIEELLAANQEISDLINMEHAVSAQAARQKTAPTTLRKVADRAVDAALFVTNPVALAKKHAIRTVLPRAVRGAEDFVANSATQADDSVLTRGAPLLEALRAEKQRDRERARMFGGR